MRADITQYEVNLAVASRIDGMTWVQTESFFAAPDRFDGRILRVLNLRDRSKPVRLTAVEYAEICGEILKVVSLLWPERRRLNLEPVGLPENSSQVDRWIAECILQLWKIRDGVAKQLIKIWQDANDSGDPGSRFQTTTKPRF